MVVRDSENTIICRYNDVFLSVRVLGSGKKKIVAFHGYGQDGNVFKEILSKIPDVAIYSFDLFYHGSSDSPDPQPELGHQFLGNLFEDFLNQAGIKNFTLIGFSMGGKYALSILKSFPHRVDKMVLIAPDGIKKDFWYTLATKYLVFRKVFHMLINKPAFFRRSALLLDKLKLVDGRVRKFATVEMNTFEKRKRVYKSWMYLKKLFVNKKDLADLINQHAIPIVFVLGKFDRIIPSRPIENFAAKLNTARVVFLKSGHTNILDKFIEDVEDII